MQAGSPGFGLILGLSVQGGDQRNSGSFGARINECTARTGSETDHRARAGEGALCTYSHSVKMSSFWYRLLFRITLTRLRLRPTRCIISDRHSKRATRCSDTSPRTIHITARSAERIAGSPLSGPRPFKATIVAVSYMRLLALRLERSLFPFAMRRNGVGVLLSCDQKLDSFASYFMMQVL